MRALDSTICYVRMLLRFADCRRFFDELFPDDPDLPGAKRAQWMNGHHQRDVLTVVEDRCGDGHHGLFAATGVVVGEEADRGELDEQLVHNVANRSGHLVAIQRADHLDGLRQCRRCPVDVEPALACVLQNAFKALRAVRIVARTPTDPRTLFLLGIPGGQCDAERRGVRNAITRYTRWLRGRFTFERCDHQRITESLDHRAGVADLAGQSQCRGTRRMRERPSGVRASGHHGERGPKSKGLRDGIAAGSSAVTQRLQDRVCRRLSEIQLAHHVGESQPRISGPCQELDNVEHPGGRR